MSRGIANRNPGNIRRSRVRYRGEVRPSRDPDFKQFESMEWGYRAMFVLLDTYRLRYGLDTLRRMISRYAPPEENHTALYIDAVCDMTGVGADDGARRGGHVADRERRSRRARRGGARVRSGGILNGGSRRRRAVGRRGLYMVIQSLGFLLYVGAGGRRMRIKFIYLRYNPIA